MPSELVFSNVVLVANQFNPSVFSQLWLVRNGLVSEDEFEPNCIFSEDAVQVRAAEFAILIVAHQLQFVPQGSVEESRQQALISDKVGGIAKLLPHTPYAAAGINFVWHVKAGDDEVLALGRRLFYRESNLLFDHFATPDAHFGGYLSKDALGYRLKLDIKPIVADGEKDRRLQFAFNFHNDLSAVEDPEKKIQSIQTMLDRWLEAKQLSATIMKSVWREE